MFKGFNAKYPEYEVLTPQTKKTFTIRSLNVAEEERMKGSFVSVQRIAEHLNKSIFEALVMKPKEITDYNTFIKMVTTKDRDALMYGLYHITYEEIRNYDVICTACRKEYSVTINASDTFSAELYPKDDILKKVVKVPLPITKGVTALIKQPTLEDEFYMHTKQSRQPGANLEILTESLIITQFQQDIEAKTEPVIYEDRGDIVDAYMSLPPKDRIKISDAYAEEFGKYSIELKMLSNCKHCGNEQEVYIDLADNFFRMVHGL